MQQLSGRLVSIHAICTTASAGWSRSCASRSRISATRNRPPDAELQSHTAPLAPMPSRLQVRSRSNHACGKASPSPDIAVLILSMLSDDRPTPAVMPIARTLLDGYARRLCSPCASATFIDCRRKDAATRTSRSFSMELATVQTHRVRIIERGLVHELRAKARR